MIVSVLKAIGCGIVESILNWVKFKAQIQLNKKCSAVKHNRIKGIPKLDDANDAGTQLTFTSVTEAYVDVQQDSALKSLTSFLPGSSGTGL